MSFRHELREAWTLGRDDLDKVIKVSGEGWTLVGVLKKVDVAGSVLAEARNRFARKNSNYLAVTVWVGPFCGPIPARALVLLEHEVKDEQTLAPAAHRALEADEVLEGEIL